MVKIEKKQGIEVLTIQFTGLAMEELLDELKQSILTVLQNVKFEDTSEIKNLESAQFFMILLLRNLMQDETVRRRENGQ